MTHPPSRGNRAECRRGKGPRQSRQVPLPPRAASEAPGRAVQHGHSPSACPRATAGGRSAAAPEGRASQRGGLGWGPSPVEVLVCPPTHTHAPAILRGYSSWDGRLVSPCCDHGRPRHPPRRHVPALHPPHTLRPWRASGSLWHGPPGAASPPLQAACAALRPTPRPARLCSPPSADVTSASRSRRLGPWASPAGQRVQATALGRALPRPVPMRCPQWPRPGL